MYIGIVSSDICVLSFIHSVHHPSCSHADLYRVVCEGDASAAASLNTTLSVEDVRQYFRRLFTKLSSSPVPPLSVVRETTATPGCSRVGGQVLARLTPPGGFGGVQRFPLYGTATEAISLWMGPVQAKHMTSRADHMPPRTVVTIAAPMRGGHAANNACECMG